MLNRKVAQAKAQQIELDIVSGNFDTTLIKYKPEKFSESSKAELLTIPKLFERFIEDKAKTVSSKTMEKYRAPITICSSFSQIDSSIS